MERSLHEYQKGIYELLKDYAVTFGGKEPTLEDIMRKYPTMEKARSKYYSIIIEETDFRKKKSRKPKAKRKSCGCK